MSYFNANLKLDSNKLGLETKKKVTFRNKKINFEIRDFFRKGSKKYRKKNSTSKLIFILRSKNNHFEVEIILK